MANYKRRFTKDEFKKELMAHLRDAPKGFQAKERLEKHAEVKAGHYERALQALDAATNRLRKIAETHPDDSARQEANLCVQEIEEAVNAYGEASMDQNSHWDKQ